MNPLSWTLQLIWNLLRALLRPLARYVLYCVHEAGSLKPQPYSEWKRTKYDTTTPRRY